MNARKFILGAICAGVVIITGIVAYSNLESSTPVISSTTPTQWVTLKVNDFEYPIDLYSNGTILIV